MIKLGTTDELYKVAHFPDAVKRSISEDVRMLDENYGAQRDIDTDMGGFVVVCERGEAIDIKNFEKDFLMPEYIQEICPYRKSLYIAGTERNIIIYEKM